MAPFSNSCHVAQTEITAETMIKILPVLAPPVFVVLWSTGFVGAKFGLPFAEPFTFLSLRFFLAAGALLLLARLFGETWRGGYDWTGAAVIGVLIHAIYLGTVFQAIYWGLGAALSALIVSLQPVATAVLARLILGERMVARQWVGICLGLLGVALVVGRNVDLGEAGLPSVMICFFGMISAAYASVLQKRRSAAGRLATDSAVQFIAAALVCAVGALVFETRAIDPAPEFFAAMAWMVIVLSLGAVTILYYMLRRGEASRVASQFFLVPAVTALMAWAMFGETFGAFELGGLIIAAVGVALVTLTPKRPA